MSSSNSFGQCPLAALTYHTTSSSFSHTDGRKVQYSGILLQTGLCQPHPIPGMPLCSQKQVGGWQAAQGQGRIAAYCGSHLILRFPLWSSREQTNQFSSFYGSPATVNSNRDWQCLSSNTCRVPPRGSVFLCLISFTCGTEATQCACQSPCYQQNPTSSSSLCKCLLGLTVE